LFRYFTLIMMFSVVLLTASVESADFDKPILVGKSELPKLPRALRGKNYRGLALIKVSVDSKGNTSDISLIKSTSLKSLDGFIIDWIEEWEFLPKLKDNKTVDGFTIITIRFNLAENSFETPPLNNLTMTLPEPYQLIYTMKSGEIQETDTGVDTNTVTPLKQLMISKIPLEIQQKNITLKTVIVISIDSKGHVLNIKRSSVFEDDQVWQWLFAQLKETAWPEASDIKVRQIEIPVILETSLCKIEFGKPRLI